jgi:predicted enzyme related to lactoylglutathione lyase
MAERKPIPGKFAWFELVTGEPKRAQAFYAEVLGWRVEAFPMGAFTYEMIYRGAKMLGGYAPPKGSARAHWLAYVSVEDVDAAAAAAVANGGKIVEPPSDIPGVGRRARIADPHGAELGLLKNTSGDMPDEPATHGLWVWNELHTPDPEEALAFYAKVIGFGHVTRDMGDGGAYHVVSRGGVERGGVTHHLPPGVPAHWLPYVAADDVDATVERAKKLGARVAIGPADIPGVGRFAVFEDPTGALLALLKPLPRT